MSKIGIVGVGMVGGALKYGFEKLGHEVKVHDTKLNTTINDVIDTDAIYVCVPTNTQSDGSCDTSIVEKCIEQILELGYKHLIVIKSTVEPGTTQRYLDRWPKARIAFVPEFLRERAAISDFIENHTLLATGTVYQSDHSDIVRHHGKYPKQVVRLTPTEAELLKYYSNVFNALRVVFANEMYEICSALGANYTDIKNAFMMRGTAADMYMDVNENFRGYAGYCLPKDTKALDALVKKLGLDLDLFRCIDIENNKFKATIFDGMRMTADS